MAEPLTRPDPTTVSNEPAAPDKHVDGLKKEYDKLAAAVAETAPNTPERHRAMQAKQAAFLKYKEAADAKVETDAVVQQAEQKQAAAESAAREAQAAKKAAADHVRSRH